MQKPPFCTPKTILLHGKNHTFVLRTCNIHRMNTLQTFREISTFNHEIPNEHSRKHPTYTPQNIHIHPRKHPTYTPPGVGDDSSCPYPYIVKFVFSHYQIRVFVSSQTHFCSSFCGYIRICGRDKSAPTAANGLLITLLANWNNVVNIPQNINIQPRKHPTNNLQHTIFKKQKTYFYFP